MNKQEMFTKVWKGLESQGWQRSAVGDNCRYRGPNGMKCAAGHLLPDENYNSLFESKNVFSLLQDHPLVFGQELDKEGEDFITRMQQAHDGYRVAVAKDPVTGKVENKFFNDMKSAFVELSVIFNLVIPTQEK